MISGSRTIGLDSFPRRRSISSPAKQSHLLLPRLYDSLPRLENASESALPRPSDLLPIWQSNPIPCFPGSTIHFPSWKVHRKARFPAPPIYFPSGNAILFPTPLALGFTPTSGKCIGKRVSTLFRSTSQPGIAISSLNPAAADLLPATATKSHFLISQL